MLEGTLDYRVSANGQFRYNAKEDKVEITGKIRFKTEGFLLELFVSVCGNLYD